MNADPLHPEESADPDLVTQYTYVADPPSAFAQEEWALVRYAGEPIGELIPLRGEQLLLGRTSKADLYLPEPEISRRHARITLAQNADAQTSVHIQDLQSTNGTFVNGQRIEVSEKPRRSF